MTDPQPSNPPPQPPLRLDYFAEHEPHRQRSRSVTLWSAVLLLGWAPYVCGIVSSLAVVRSGSSSIISAHDNAAVAFLGLGIIASVLSWIGFWRLSHGLGVLAASVVLGMQLAAGLCLGLA